MIRRMLAVLTASALLAGCQTADTLQTETDSGQELVEQSAVTELVEEESVEENNNTGESETGASDETSSTTQEKADLEEASMISSAPFLRESINPEYDPSQLDQYTIFAQLDSDAKILTCSQTVSYINKESVALSHVVFQVLPNAYKSVDTAPILFGDVSSIYPKGFEPGYIEFSLIKLNGETANYKLYGSDETLLKIELDENLSPGERVELKMEYTVQIPPAYDRFGYNDSTFNIANWYPVAAVYDHDGWNEDIYYAVGDPFYTDMATYDMTYDVPSDFEVASTGARVSESDNGTRRVIHYEAELVRDTAWLASDEWNVHVEEVEGTTIRSYYFDEFRFPEQKAVEAARDSLLIFNDLYGPYPYSELAVVATDFPSGMEYPTLVMIAKDRYKASMLNPLESVIAHEIGHQWWYGVVGNDQVDEAWLDESLTVFSTAMYFGEKYGESAYDSYVESYRNRYESRKHNDGDGVVVKPVTRFDSWSDYSNLVYRKGMLFVDALRSTYGQDKVIDFMRTYYDMYKFETVTTDDFLDLGREMLGEGFDEIVDEWLFNKSE